MGKDEKEPKYKTWIGEDGIEYESCESDDGNIIVTMPVVSDEELLIMAEEAKERRRIRNGSDGSMGLLHPHSKD